MLLIFNIVNCLRWEHFVVAELFCNSLEIIYRWLFSSDEFSNLVVLASKEVLLSNGVEISD